MLLVSVVVDVVDVDVVIVEDDVVIVDAVVAIDVDVVSSLLLHPLIRVITPSVRYKEEIL